MATTLEIVKGIHQAASHAYDGSHDEKMVGEDMVAKIGLRREEGCTIKDSRVIDGFNVKVLADTLFLMYHTEVTAKESHKTSFLGEVEQSMADIVKFLKKEYKKVTEGTLSLTKPSEVDVNMQYISRLRTSVVATQTFLIGGIDVDHYGSPSEDRLDKSIKDFLSLGKDKAKKPSNYTAKNEK